MKLNDLVRNNRVKAFGFSALVNLSGLSDQAGAEVVVSSIAPAVMLDMGFEQYYAPILKRGVVFTTPEDVLDADLDCNLIRVSLTDEIKPDDPVLIVSRHPGTIEILQDLFPNNSVRESVTPDDIRGRDEKGEKWKV